MSNLFGGPSLFGFGSPEGKVSEESAEEAPDTEDYGEYGGSVIGPGAQRNPATGGPQVKHTSGKRRAKPSAAALKTPTPDSRAVPTPGTGKSDQLTRVVIYSDRDLESEEKCFAPRGTGLTFCTTDADSCKVRE